jgi:hypothetical protein
MHRSCLYKSLQDWNRFTHPAGFCTTLSYLGGRAEIVVVFCLVAQARIANLLLALCEVVFFIEGFPLQMVLVGSNSSLDS